MAERILITGGAGFVGLHLARRLAAEGAEITLVDDLSQGRLDDDMLRVLAGNVQFVRYDLTSPIPSDLLPGRFDVVYHLAAIVGVSQVDRDPAHVLRTNILSFLRLLEWCGRRPPKAVFLSSSSEVADGAAVSGLCQYPVREDVPFVLQEPRLARASYALSKIVTEAMLLQRQDQFRVRIGRYYNIYGPRMGNAHVIPQFIERLLERVTPFPIYGAYQSRTFCYVDDAVEATIRLVRVDTNAPLVANIGNDREEIQIIELAHHLFALADARPDLAILDPPAGSPDRRLPDLTTLRLLTGHEPRVALIDGLRRTFTWYLERWPNEAT